MCTVAPEIIIYMYYTNIIGVDTSDCVIYYTSNADNTCVVNQYRYATLSANIYCVMYSDTKR